MTWLFRAEAVGDLGLRLGRTELVLAGDVQQQRLGDRAGLAERLLDADAVIADIGIGVGARRHEIGELAAEAVADGADLAVALRQARRCSRLAIRSLDALGLVEALIELEGALPIPPRSCR